MVKIFPRVTTRQRAFLLEHGFDLGDVIGEPPLGDDGVRVLRFASTHPWAEHSKYDIRGGQDWGELTIHYPDEATRRVAQEAREGDWLETIGPDGQREIAAATSILQQR